MTTFGFFRCGGSGRQPYRAGFNDKQIERVCHQYGQCVEDLNIKDIEVNGYEEVLQEKADELHYVSVNGSMYLTREEGWKEIKLGRIYRESDLVRASDKRSIIARSQYVAHLGNSKDFLPKMEYYVEGLKRKIFIADGAIWIWNWVEDTYPDSVQIVDYFHSKEHLCEFAKEYFKDKRQREKWIDEQSGCMLEKEIAPVIKTLEKLPERKSTKKKLDQLLNYYKNNQSRMEYHVFKSNGWQIG